MAVISPGRRPFRLFRTTESAGYLCGALESGATTLLASGSVHGRRVCAARISAVLQRRIDGWDAVCSSLRRQSSPIHRRTRAGHRTGAVLSVSLRGRIFPSRRTARCSSAPLAGSPPSSSGSIAGEDSSRKCQEPWGTTRAALSPDEKTIAADRLDPETQSQDVWLIETTRGVTSRLTTNRGHDQMSLWSPDGTRIIYGSTREGEANGTRVKTLSGGGPDEPLFGSSSDARIHQMKLCAARFSP